MANAKSSHLLRQVRTLFGAGTVTGLSDAQLLERFTSRSAKAAEDALAAEAAFGVLVARHGPMVLGVCRRALADERDIEDAFQATFLVLVRRAGSVRVGDSLGRWLYGVSRRVAAKARARSQRERSRTTSLDVELAAVAFKLKVSATVLLALGLAGFVAVGAGKQPETPVSGREPAVASQFPPPRSSPHRPPDKIVKEIETLLKTTRRPMLHEDHLATRENIAKLINELRTAYPLDPRVARFLPERWTSLNYTKKRALAYSEINAVLKTTENPVLRKDALFFQTGFRFLDPLDGSTSVSLAEAFIRQAPGDNRAGEFLYTAATKLDAGWVTRLSLIAVVVGVGISTLRTVRKRVASTRRWLKPAVRLAGLAVLMLVSSLCVFRWLAPDTFAALIGSLSAKLGDAAMRRRCLFIASALVNQFLRDLMTIATSGRMGIAVLLAAATGLLLVVVRPRSAGNSMRWMSSTRLGMLGFSATLAMGLVVDSWLITRQRDELRERIVREYPDSFRGRMVQGQRRQHKRVGEPFELEFTDAITGRPVSMKALRGKVVVVDFWATWCGPCVAEVAELKRLYAEYHDKGVEFIGVSHDVPEEHGGLEALRTFVKKWRMPWPQYFLGVDNQAVRTGSPTNDFSESWGINGIPTVFLIDAEGKLYSSEAEGQLDTLIPRLLAKRGAPSPQH